MCLALDIECLKLTELIKRFDKEILIAVNNV